jgi:hypothetical protein
MKDWISKRLKEIKLPGKVLHFPLRTEDVERKMKAGLNYDRFCGDDDHTTLYSQSKEQPDS